MFSWSDFIYYSLMSACLILSYCTSGRFLPGLKYLRILLMVGFVGELVNEFIDEYSDFECVFYHFYIPFEFSMLMLFFSEYNQNFLVKWIKACIIPLFIIFSLAYSFFFDKLTKYPSVQYNLDCVLVAIYVIVTMLAIVPHETLKITKLPIFWFCIGLLVFYTGIVLYNGTKNMLEQNDEKLARLIRLIVNMNFNYLLYISWIYGFICTIQIRKSSLR